MIPQRRVSSKKASQSSLRCFNSTMPHNTSSSLLNNYLTPLNCSVCSHTSIQPQTQSATYTNLLKALHISHCIPLSFYEASINLLVVINLIPSIHLCTINIPTSALSNNPYTHHCVIHSLTHPLLQYSIIYMPTVASSIHLHIHH